MKKKHNDSMKNIETLRQILAERRERENRVTHASACSGIPNKMLVKILKASSKFST